MAALLPGRCKGTRTTLCGYIANSYLQQQPKKNLEKGGKRGSVTFQKVISNVSFSELFSNNHSTKVIRNRSYSGYKVML